MLDDAIRSAIALKKFSLISPIINGQISAIGEYCRLVTEKPIDMPHYGLKMYSPKTIACWYSDYVREGLDALKPKPRADKGGTRKITSELEDILLKKRDAFPRAPITVIYDMLLKKAPFRAVSFHFQPSQDFITAWVNSVPPTALRQRSCVVFLMKQSTSCGRRM